MKRRLISVVLFAVLAAAVSSALLYKIISSGAPGKSKPTTAIVLVASRDLDAGAMVGDADVRPAEFPATEGSHWLAQRNDVVGRALLTPLAKDEPFAESRLAAKGAGAGLASRIPRGMRMVAVHVDELTGLSRFILSGMHVDVISTGNSPGTAGQGMMTRTVLQDVEVFSTGDSSHDPKASATTNGAPVFNLLVTPQQAEVLSQAMATTRIELVLRNPLDKGSIISEALPQIKLPELPVPAKASPAPFRPQPRPVPEKSEKKVEVPPPPPALPTVEVIHGTKRTVNPVAPSTGSEPIK